MYKDWLLEAETGVHERIQREQQLSSFEHTNVCRIYSYSEETLEARTFRFLVLEYVKGKSLGEFIKSAGSLPWSGFTPLAQQLTQAVLALHRAGKIHRDVKPDNVLLETGTDRAVLADFGVVGSLLKNTKTVTETAEFLGTIAYAAPEWLFREPPDAGTRPEVDVYSLGATFLEMMSGRPPYHEDQNFALKILRIRSFTPEVRSVGYPREVEHLVRQMIARDPDARPNLETVVDTLRTAGSDRDSQVARKGSVAAPPAIERLRALDESRPDVTMQWESDTKGRVWLSLRGRIVDQIKKMWQDRWGADLENHPFAKLRFIKAIKWEERLPKGTIRASAKFPDSNFAEVKTLYPDVGSWDTNVGWTFVPSLKDLMGLQVHYFIAPVDLLAPEPSVTVIRCVGSFREGPIDGELMVETLEDWTGTAEHALTCVNEDIEGLSTTCEEVLATLNGA